MALAGLYGPAWGVYLVGVGVSTQRGSGRCFPSDSVLWPLEGEFWIIRRIIAPVTSFTDVSCLIQVWARMQFTGSEPRRHPVFGYLGQHPGRVVFTAARHVPWSVKSRSYRSRLVRTEAYCSPSISPDRRLPFVMTCSITSRAHGHAPPSGPSKSNK
jgi:hypothetical protein